MKSLRFVVAAVSFSLIPAAYAAAQESHHPAVKKPVPTAAQQAFDRLKALAGSWEGRLTVDPPVPDMAGRSAQVWFRVASRGHTLMHDMRIEGLPDNPLTLLVVDADRLLLTHYCDADNRPRMIGRASPDGRTVEFDFLDVSGNMAHGHMRRAVFTFVDENRHTEEWTFMMPGDKPMRARFDLQRTPAGTAVSGR